MMTTAFKLAALFDTELHSDLSKILITRDKTGKYTLFGRYSIRPITDMLFIVADALSSEISEFATIKNAIAWCALRNSKKYADARRLQTLDLKLCSLNADMAIHKRMYKSAQTPTTKLIYQIKLQEDAHKRRHVVNEMDTVTRTSRMLQERNFTWAKDHNSK